MSPDKSVRYEVCRECVGKNPHRTWEPDQLERIRQNVLPQSPHGNITNGVTPQEVLDLIVAVQEMRSLLFYLAEGVGAQTLDVKAIGKGRRATLEKIINGMLEGADNPGNIYLTVSTPRRGDRSSASVRERFEIDPTS